MEEIKIILKKSPHNAVQFLLLVNYACVNMAWWRYKPQVGLPLCECSCRTFMQTSLLWWWCSIYRTSAKVLKKRAESGLSKQRLMQNQVCSEALNRLCFCVFFCRGQSWTTTSSPFSCPHDKTPSLKTKRHYYKVYNDHSSSYNESDLE